jgi:hypothetical protein
MHVVSASTSGNSASVHDNHADIDWDSLGFGIDHLAPVR